MIKSILMEFIGIDNLRMIPLGHSNITVCTHVERIRIAGFIIKLPESVELQCARINESKLLLNLVDDSLFILKELNPVLASVVNLGETIEVDLSTIMELA